MTPQRFYLHLIAAIGFSLPNLGNAQAPLFFWNMPLRLMTCELMLSPKVRSFASEEPIHVPLNDMTIVANNTLGAGLVDKTMTFESVYYSGPANKLDKPTARTLRQRINGIRDALEHPRFELQTVALHFRGPKIAELFTETQSDMSDLNAVFSRARSVGLPWNRKGNIVGLTFGGLLAAINVWGFATMPEWRDYAGIAAFDALVAYLIWYKVLRTRNMERFDWEFAGLKSLMLKGMKPSTVFMSSHKILLPEAFWEKIFSGKDSSNENVNARELAIKMDSGTAFDQLFPPDLETRIALGYAVRHTFVDHFAYFDKTSGEPVYVLVIRGYQKNPRIITPPMSASLSVDSLIDAGMAAEPIPVPIPVPVGPQRPTPPRY